MFNCEIIIFTTLISLQHTAYSILSDKKKRKQYDQFGHSNENSNSHGFDFSNFHDHFNDFFDMDKFFSGFDARNAEFVLFTN